MSLHPIEIPFQIVIAGFTGFCALMLAGCQEPPSGGGVGGAFDGSAGRWLDLSHAYSEETLYWPTDTQGFVLEELAFGKTEVGYFYSAYRFSSAEHGGTHVDAPLHFSRNGLAVDAIPIDRLIGPAVVVDVRDRVTPDYQISRADLEAFEADHGSIPAGAIVLLRTGWAERWPDHLRYLGTAATGEAAVAELHFPGLHPDAARWIVERGTIAAVGIDTASIDYGQSTGFASHVALYAANVPALENVANLDELPETGGFIVALPMKIQGGSGGPVRIAAFVPD